MNIQSLKSKLLKGETDSSKEVVAVIGNQEYTILDVTKSPGKVLLVTELKDGIHVGESAEDEKAPIKGNPDFGELPVEPLSFSSFDPKTGIGTKLVVDIASLPEGLSVEDASIMKPEELKKVIENHGSSTTVAEDIKMDENIETKKNK